MYGLVEESAIQEIAAMPIDVVYSDGTELLSRLDQALNLVTALYNKIHVARIRAGWLNTANHVHDGRLDRGYACSLSIARRWRSRTQPS